MMFAAPHSEGCPNLEGGSIFVVGYNRYFVEVLGLVKFNVFGRNNGVLIVIAIKPKKQYQPGSDRCRNQASHMHSRNEFHFNCYAPGEVVLKAIFGSPKVRQLLKNIPYRLSHIAKSKQRG